MCEFDELLCGCTLKSGSISILVLDISLFLITALFSCLAITFLYEDDTPTTENS